jgi:hypothetical protein
MPRLLRVAGALGALALPFAPAVLAGTAHADTGSPAASASASAGPTLAGTSFRTATPLMPDQAAQATGAIGDYFYWSFQAQAGQTPNITATVQLPPGTQRHGTSGWRLDLYDGLRRDQPCVSGSPQAQAFADTGQVQLSCTLPSIRTWADTWSNDPLPGTYYIRLTVGDLAEQDLGLPISAQLTLSAPTGDTASADGSLSTPLSLPSSGPSPTTPSADDASTQSSSTASSPALADTASGPSAGLFSNGNARWWWTGGAAVTASLTAVIGFSLSRHPRRWFS